MANETKVGELSINLKIRLEELEKGLETAKKKLQSIEEENKKVQNSNKGLESSYIAVSAVAVTSLLKIGGVIKDCINEYKEYTQAMSSLQNVSEFTGTSMNDFASIMNKFSAYMTKADMATTIKNFSLMGMTVKQTEQMMEALTNSAIRNRNANYTTSEAVRVASEGYRQGLSTLSDSAGVTENLSVQLDIYAKSMGKTASQLTEAEKNQAYLNRTMIAAEPFASAMSDYMDTLAGKQGQYSQAMRETQVAYTEALEPVLSGITTIGTEVLNVTGQFIKDHPTLTAGVTSFGTTLAGVTVALVALTTAKKAYATATGVATMSTKAFTTALLANPLTWITVGIAATISGITMLCSAIRENEEAQLKLNEATERYDKIKNNAYDYKDSNLSQLEADKEAIEEQIKLKEKQIEIQKQINEINARSKDTSGNSPTGYWYSDEDLKTIDNLKRKLKEVGKSLEEARKSTSNYGNTLKELKENQEVNAKEISKVNVQKNISNLLDTESIKNKKKEASTAVETAKSYQQLFQTYQEGKKGTKEYENAVTALEEKFPEAVNANGIMAKDMKILIDDMARNAQTSWDNTQSVIQDRIAKITEAIANCNPEIDVNGTYAKSLSDKIGIPTNEVIGSLQTALSLFDMLLNKDSDEVGGGKSKYTPPKTNKSSKTYQNKALDNYKKQIEYKKSLDQISLQEEISMYETALKKYAKTQDEKMELTTKVYELKKELQQAELDNDSALIDYLVSMDKISKQEQIGKYEWELKYLAKTTDQKRDLEVKIYELRKELNEEIAQQIKDEADKEREILNRKTEDYKRYIQDQKNLRGAEYDVKEQEADLNKIIEMHQNYLNQIMKDERYSLDERESIYREELEIIRDYEQQKRDARVSSVNNTVSQLKSAITKQIEEMQEADEKAIKKNIELVEEWKNTRIDAINAEYNARIEAIQKELDALDKAEQQKSRDEEDAEYEKKKKRLEELAEYEHDATTKANYLKELAKLEEEYQKTVDKRLLEDKKEALKEQQDLLKEEQTSKTDAIKEEAEKQKEQYETQLDDLKEYYDKQKEMAQETAEKMLLNVEQNQNQILSLLNKYGDKYEITGQSLGEKLAQGINNGLANKIQGIIQTIQDRIDGAIENQISKWTSAAYQYEQATSKAQTKTVQTNVTQNNYIQQNPEMPSETYRKLNNVSRNLAAELAGV